MWDYVPILIGVFGASMVVGIYWKLKKNTVSRLKLLRIALYAACVLSLISVRNVPLKSGAALIWFWIAEFVLYLVIATLVERLKKVYKEFRSDPQRYLISRVSRVNESMKPIVEALVPKDSWNDIRISKPVWPGSFQVGVAIGASLVALGLCVIIWVFFFSEEEYLRLVVWIIRYSLLFSAVIITLCYLMVLVILAALQWFHAMVFPIRFGKSLQCVADWSGYGAALASCLVLVLPALSLFLGIKLNSANRPSFSLSLLFDAASVGALGGLVFGCLVGLFRLIDSRNVLYNSICPAVFFGLLNLGFIYGAFGLRPSVLLNRYVESYPIDGVDACDNAETAKLIFDECLSWKCERFLAVAKKCDSSVNAFVVQNDKIYFWAVLICLVFCVLWRLVRSIRCAKGGLSEGVVSSA